MSKLFTHLYDDDNNDNNNISNSSSPQSALDTLVLFHTNNTTTTVLNPSSVAAPMAWTTTQFTPVSPASPTSSCFSFSGNDTETETESVYFSPIACIIPYDNLSAADTSLDAVMMELEDSIDYTSVAEVALFTHEFQQQQQQQQGQHQYCDDESDQGQEEEEKPHHVNKGALHISENNVNYNNASSIPKSHHGYGNSSMNATGTTGGPSRRSGSLSPLATFAPYPFFSSSSTSAVLSSDPLSLNYNHNHHHHRQHHHNDNNNNNNTNNNYAMWQQQDFSEPEQHQYKQEEQDDTNSLIDHDYDYDNDNDDAMSTCSSSSSLSSAPSSRCSSPETSISASALTSSSTPAPTAPVRIPGTEGMSTIHQNDGSIMCFNPATGACIYFCDICLAADPPTSPSSPFSNGHLPSFGRIHDLKRHQSTKHPQAASIHGRGPPKVWPCEFCEKPFTRRDALLRHYTVKSARDDGVHPTKEQQVLVDACRARAKRI
ncbi:MAG: hypothetical protein J3R72DRAFT_433299 [Linnemannia gamsii]|nr:MAG: hypothetical protein J3R72DRAFT_433299 [Linnemannia gamsii]